MATDKRLRSVPAGVDPATGEIDRRSIEDMANDQQEFFGRPRMQGRQLKLTLNAGGRPVTHSVLKFKAPDIPLHGQFAEGDKVFIVLEATVVDVDFKVKLDKDGYFDSKTRVHIADVEDWNEPEPKDIIDPSADPDA